MFVWNIFLISALWSWVSLVSASQVSEAFVANEIVPDAISTPPLDSIEVTYGSKSVDLGNELAPRDVRNAPEVYWDTDGDEDTLYTLFLLDLDVPSRVNHFLRSLIHWMVGNIKNNDISTGTVYRQYLSPTPIICTGLHRYVFLLYKQPNYLQFDNLTDEYLFYRFNFYPNKFSEDYGVGDPVAGNFFQSQFKIANSTGVCTNKFYKMKI